MVMRGKQEDARHCFGLAVQSAMAEKRPTELAKGLQIGGRGEDQEEIAEKENVGGKKKEMVVDKPEASQREKAAKKQ